MIAFVGGVAITASGLALAIIRHRLTSSQTAEEYISHLRMLSIDARLAIQRMNAVDSPPKQYCSLDLVDLWAMYRNSRTFLRLSSILLQDQADEDIKFYHDKISETHDKLFVSLAFCIVENATRKVVNNSFGAYTGVSAWLYNEQVALIESLSSECTGRESLTDALEALY
jgi:hypothetical protein